MRQTGTASVFLSVSMWLLSVIALAVFALASPSAHAAATLSGMVVTPEGKPAADAVVKLYYFHDPVGYGSCWLSETRSDRQGRFSIVKPDHTPPPAFLRDDLEGVGYYLVGLHPDYAIGMTAFQPARKDGYVVCLSPGRRIVCTVVDEAGRPVGGATVRLVQYWYRDGLFPSGQPLVLNELHRFIPVRSILAAVYTATTSDGGTIEFPNAPTVRCDFNATMPAGEAGYVDVAENEGDQVTVKLSPPAFTIKGRVTAADTGRPVPGIAVSINVSSTITDKDGNYSLTWPNFEQRGQLLLMAVDLGKEPDYSVFGKFLPELLSGELRLDIQLERGLLLKGTVVDRITGKPLAGTTVCLMKNDSDGSSSFHRSADEAGEFSFRGFEAGDWLWPRLAPQGYLLTGIRGGEPGKESEGVVTVTMRCLMGPLERGRIVIKTRQGQPVPEASLVAFEGGVLFARGATLVAFEGGVVARGATGYDGRVEVVGFSRQAAQPLGVFALSADSTAGLYATVSQAKLAAGEQIELQLRPTREVEVALEDEEGRESPGKVAMWPAFSESAVAWDEDNMPESPARIRFVPGMTYVVRGRTKRGEEARLWPERIGLWSWDEVAPVPRLTVRYDNRIRQRAIAHERKWKSDLEQLKTALWSKEDPVQKDLKWHGVKDGVALADSKEREVAQFTEILGETQWTVSGIAFGKEKVWLGTNKGLFAWDRADRIWSRIAVGGSLIDALVTGLTLTDAGLLKVTAEEQGKPATRMAGKPAAVFEYDTATGRWK